ncbi:hypothetical protein GIB67_040606 [Kingdonia uniflora]|uniref:F-box domain-containing protein n=1 Tax=Kingdonia uniflora TaxID=39325 RepID=A0A7J7M8Y1_9MAGN|nr:hypothetical protein GIB67_040606 [Kingdonia uniflora]
MDVQNESRCKLNSGCISIVIDDLPNNIFEHILVRLPIKEAVRTSVLSKSWRNKWAGLLELVFDDESISFPLPSNEEEPLDHSGELVSIIDQVLLHQGPIVKFVLSNSHLKSTSSICRWISYLTRNGIKDLTLHFHIEPCKVPMSLFYYQQLSSLKLDHCVANLPPSFNGLRSLKVLELEYTTIINEDFESLIYGCPHLERLVLRGIINVHHPRNIMPNLKD